MGSGEEGNREGKIVEGRGEPGHNGEGGEEERGRG